MALFDLFRQSARIRELEDDFSKVRREFQALEAEWTLAYDKLRKMMQRIAKRAEVAEKLADAAEEEPQPIRTPGGLPMHGGVLSDRQRVIQQQILRRRAGG